MAIDIEDFEEDADKLSPAFAPKVRKKEKKVKAETKKTDKPLKIKTRVKSLFLTRTTKKLMTV